LQTSHQVDQSEQVGGSNMSTPRGLRDEGIRRLHIRPARGYQLQITCVIGEVHPVLTPRLSNRKQLEAASEQGMEGVGDLDNSLLIGGMGRS